MKYIDIHGHLNFKAFDGNREEVIGRAREAGVAMISVGSQMDTSRKALEIAKTHEDVYACVGLHPIHTSASDHDIAELGEGSPGFTSRGEEADLGAYLELARDPKTVAIGECGLDYYHVDSEANEKQRKGFETMIEVANSVNKPLMLHLRSPGPTYKGPALSAYRDAYDVLKAKSKVAGNLHFFAGNIEEAKLFLDIGYSFSFTGVVTFARNYDEVIRYIPSDRIMSETDCPYVTPIPYRGKQNEPLYVIEVVKALAKIRNEDETKFSAQLLENARNFFKIG